jgi:uncharacterized protein YxjI
MDVLIQEKSFSFGVEYEINTPTKKMTALKKVFSMLPHIAVQDASDEVLAEIKSESFFRSKFTIVLRAGNTYHYHCEKVWKGVDICEGPNGPYHLYTHKGVRYSIFQGDTQIAAFTGNKWIVGNGRTYDLRVNADADLLLVISMLLCLNTENGDDHNDNTVTYDFGNIGPEDRKFDEAWGPTDAVTP